MSKALRDLWALLPQGYDLAEDDWRRRHRLLTWVLGLHLPLLAAFGIGLAHTLSTTAWALAGPAACVLLGHLTRGRRRVAAVFVTAGLVYCSVALVALTSGAIEAHFHFFIIIGFIALYQDWVPFLVNVGFTVLSHGIGSAWQTTLIFNHVPGQANPWVWSLIHGVAVLVACVGMMMFWRVTEDQQNERDALARDLAEAELNRRAFTSDMLVNLARRNQNMLHRQLEIINQLEESERDPDALAELFRLDHLTTRVRRNAESLLVLSGEQPARIWRDPVPLRDVVRAAIAETEDLDRVVVDVDERPALAGNAVTDITHLLAELTENAVRSSPPGTTVTVRSRPNRADPGGQVLIVEDLGVGMPFEEMESANRVLAEAPDVDLAVSKRLGFHVVARLAARHDVQVRLVPTPGSGLTALVTIPGRLLEERTLVAAGANGARHHDAARPVPLGARPQAVPARERADEGAAATQALPSLGVVPDADWPGWWNGAGEDRHPPAAVREASRRPLAGAERPALPEPRPPVTPASLPPSPVPRSAPPPAAPSLSEGGSGLRRRVPQASLSPQLRESSTADAADPVPIDPGAAMALSRYQSQRRAAQHEVAQHEAAQQDGEVR